MQSVLITGANGFIGGHLAEEAKQHNLKVLAGVRQGSNVGSLKDLNIEVVYLNYEDQDQLTAVLKQYKPDYIIHNAGLTRSPSYAQYLKVNRDYLINIVEAIRKSGIPLKKLLFVSSLAAFGPADFQPDHIVRENSMPHPVTQYGKSKLEAENWLKNQSDIPYNIVRPTAVYGPGEKDLLNVFQMVSKGINATAGSGQQQLTLIYVKDLVRLMMLATLTTHTHRAYFGTDGRVYGSGDFPQAIAHSLNKKILSIALPVFIVKIGAWISEGIGKITGKYPTLYVERVNEIKARNWQCDTDNLEKDLQFKPAYTMQQAVDETTSWYKQNKWI
ncbi:MAG TPA: NAD(P)-dependent oxidoreductase [Saprospiraceae bacterium]|nr:NAD(P)-dependent oxidoreductase [Saprospiraceae bacterium]HRO09788.1 NAD(P)-dependent oxidoreductase [Saprospiraceae bacterium]HRO72718.1 NAD(P)-dependent oxidoreductase [Saprospiraceae bacterium]HRP43041.1 NAD(P)-dependent oxidoreductase [Saprospiraceae bacterium]